MKTLILVLSLALSFLCHIPATSQHQYEFHYEDIENFRKVLEVVRSGGDTLAAINTYFENASEGMRGWLDRYGTKPALMVKTIKYFPKYYDYLSTIDTKLMSYEEEISKGLDGIRKLYPSEFVHIPPIYYFILFSGGGSVEMTANMMSVDYFGMHEDLDHSEFDRIGGLYPEGKFHLVDVELIPHVTVHETAHLLQAYMQGEIDYVSIYEQENQTIQAYAIREGGADFLTWHGAGLIDSVKAAYGDTHEKELWQAMEPILEENIDDHKGWFSGKNPDHPDWPFQIGYYMGFKMVQHYFEQSEDKEAALTLIFNANQPEDFQKFVEVYRKKWD